MFDVTNGQRDTADLGNCNREGIPEWLEDFTENLETAEVLAPAEISHDSDPERLVKVASPRKTQIVRSASTTRILCKRRIGNSVRRKYG